MFRKTAGLDKLDRAHSLGLGAISFVDDLVSDLDEATVLANDRANEALDEVDRLKHEADSAISAADKYASVADKLRALVSA